jgi:hypothetical protein
VDDLIKLFKESLEARAVESLKEVRIKFYPAPKG